MKITLALAPGDYALVQAKAHDDLTNIPAIAAQIISCWCADHRRDKRLRLSPHHYTARHAVEEAG